MCQIAKDGKALPKSMMTGADSPAFSIGKIPVLVSLRKTATAFYHVTFSKTFFIEEGLNRSQENLTCCQQRL